MRFGADWTRSHPNKASSDSAGLKHKSEDYRPAAIYGQGFNVGLPNLRFQLLSTESAARRNYALLVRPLDSWRQQSGPAQRARVWTHSVYAIHVQKQRAEALGPISACRK